MWTQGFTEYVYNACEKSVHFYNSQVIAAGAGIYIGISSTDNT